jgi:HAE1 family hydrophobic/amphiphilic exporter-1
MQALPQLVDVNNEQKLGALVTRLEIDRVEASRYGLTPSDIDAALYDAFGLRRVTQYQTAVNQYSILLTLTHDYQGERSSLEVIQLRSPLTGAMIPLSQLAKVLPPQNGAVEIEHSGLYPAVTISFNLAAKVALGDAVQAIDQLTQTIGLPDSIQGQYSGSAQAFAESLESQPWLILAALIAVYIILGVLYESFLDPVIILSTLPSAGLGALLALWLTGFEFSIMALIGLILLIGIVKKNGILMVDFARQARLDGATAFDAIYQACLVRFRPITMTTIAALLGAVPLVLGLGEGAELRQPLGVAVVGGLLVSQVLTLFSTPVIYLLLTRRWEVRTSDRD